ncbi:MAG: type II toxin-antitoxin system MqsA family antitoxin [Chloroflexi bacterium]|nr:type II toxin-antitoxin system MqsA family antitoxin [Chloroflexota bacterium]
MKCDQCQGQYREKTIVLSFQRQGKSIVIEGVPATVCDLCGDTLLSESTVREVEELLEQQPQATAPLYRFREKTPPVG